MNRNMNTKNLLIRLLVLSYTFILFSSCKKDENDNRIIFSDNNYSFDYDSIIDIEGNTYRTIALGAQTWMVDNLKSSTYNDGTPIILAENATNWLQDTIGVYCQHNEAYLTEIYGNFYNWYAVKTNKLCPDGWHIPTNDEWDILERYLGTGQLEPDLTMPFEATNEGSKLAGNDTLWIDDVIKRDSEFGISGFKGIPAGYIGLNGEISTIGEFGSWWSTTKYEYDTIQERIRACALLSEYKIIVPLVSYKSDGMSVRCIKD